MNLRNEILTIIVTAVTLAVTASLFGQQSGTIIGPNILKNPSFEEVRNGKTPNWSWNARTFSVCDETAHTGKYCIKYSNDDIKHYDFCSQSLPVVPGEKYLYSCWIKTEAIQGNENGANICIQWVDKKGKYLGGAFPVKGVKGTQKEWTKISGITQPIPKEAARVSLSIYVRREMTGTAWFDDISVQRYVPPLLNVMTTDRYRQCTAGGMVHVDLGINRMEGDKFPDQIKLTVSSPVLEKSLVVVPTDLEKDAACFEFDSTPLPVGDYTLTAKAVHPKSGKTESLSLKMTRVKSFPKRKAYIDEHRRLILDGKPFFPLGLYFGGVNDKELELYSKSSYNCLMPYGRLKRETIDKIGAKGIKVIYNVKDIYKDSSGCKTEEEADNLVRKVVDGLKDHPAIIAWYVNDEYPLTRIRELVGRRDQMEELDPSRPTWAVLYQVGEIRHYLPSFDVVGTDPYPVATKPVKMAWNWSVQTNRGVFKKKAVWQVPQIFDWSLHKKSMAERQKERAPSYEEMRAMYWMGIAGGANGLIAYCWHDLYHMDKGPSNQPRTPLVRKPFDQSWKEVSDIAAEIAAEFPILLAVDQPIAVTVIGQESKETVAWRVYGKGHQTWILLVNLSEKDATDVVLKTEKSVRLIGTKLGAKEKGKPSVTIKDKTISTTLQPLEPLMIGIE